MNVLEINRQTDRQFIQMDIHYNGKNYSIIVKDFTRSITNQISQYSNL